MNFELEPWRSSQEEAFPLWERLNFICVAFQLTPERVSEISSVLPEHIGAFREGRAELKPYERDRILYFVERVEAAAASTIERFKFEFARTGSEGLFDAENDTPSFGF